MLKSTSLVSFPSKAPCKRTQHCCMYMLRPFAHPVACCCGKFETGQTFELPTFLLDSFAQLFKHCWGQARNKLAVELKGRFPFNKSSGLKFRKIKAPNGRYIPVAQSRPKPMLVWLLLLQAGCKRVVLGTTVLSNGNGRFGPADRPTD